MISIVLTGINHGLGKELYTLLQEYKYVEHHRIFIARDIVDNSDSPTIDFVQMDLLDEAIDTGKIKIQPATQTVIFISNAGIISPIGPAAKIDIDDLQTALRVNLLSPLSIAQHLSVETKKCGAHLFILNVSSGAANRAIPGWLAYCVSKSSAKMAFDVLAAENQHVEVNHFDPGVMDTDMQATIRSQDERDMPDVAVFKSYKESGRLKSSRDVAKQILSLIEKELE